MYNRIQQQCSCFKKGRGRRGDNGDYVKENCSSNKDYYGIADRDYTKGVIANRGVVHATVLDTDHTRLLQPLLPPMLVLLKMVMMVMIM